MTLHQWIKFKGGDAEVAKLLKVDKSTVTKWRNFKLVPNSKTATLIIKKSKGKLDYNKIYRSFYAN